MHNVFEKSMYYYECKDPFQRKAVEGVFLLRMEFRWSQKCSPSCISVWTSTFLTCKGGILYLLHCLGKLLWRMKRGVLCRKGSFKVLCRQEMLLICSSHLNAHGCLGALFIKLSLVFHTELISTFLELQTLVPTPISFAPSFPISNQSLKPDESLFPFPPSLFAPSFITQIKTVSLYIRWWDSTVGIYRPRSAPRGTLCGGILQSIQLCCRHHLAGASLSSFSISAFHHTGTLVQYSFPPSSFMISKPQPFSQAFSRIPGHIDPSFFIILESRNCCDYCKLLPTVNDPC